jgi:TolB-like protein
MKQGVIATAVCIMLSAATARAQAASPDTQPTTQPTVTTPAPASVPTVDVLVLPFAPISPADDLAWVGQAVQQNLMTDLGRGHLRPAGMTELITDPLSSGRLAGARFVISGTYQMVDGMLRFTGQIIDVASTSVVGGLSATGSPRDLFALEDTLSGQALHQLQRLNSPPAAPVAAQSPPAQPAAGNPVTFRPYDGSDLEAYVNSNRTPSVDYWNQYRASYNRQTYYSYPSYYGYPYWGYYSYPFAYGWGYSTPIVIIRYQPHPAVFYSNDHSMRP